MTEKEFLTKENFRRVNFKVSHAEKFLTTPLLEPYSLRQSIDKMLAWDETVEKRDYWEKMYMLCLHERSEFQKIHKEFFARVWLLVQAHKKIFSES